MKSRKLKGKESLLKVAVVQMEPQIGEKEENVAKTCRFIDEATEEGASLIILPELCSTGYVFNTRKEAFELAEPISEGPTITCWIKKAREHNIYIVAGIAEKTESKLYNSAVLLGPEGFIGTYRKLHLWYEEKLFFHPGDLGLSVFDLPFGRLGMLICYDLWFPEASRILMLQGVDIICNPTNWVPPLKPVYDEAGRCMANYLVIANAHSNAVYIACADRVGVERGQAFEGRSIIVGPSGWPLAGPASSDEEELLFADVNIVESRRFKTRTWMNDIIRDRRTDIYDWMLGYSIASRYSW